MKAAEVAETFDLFVIDLASVLQDYQKFSLMLETCDGTFTYAFSKQQILMPCHEKFPKIEGAQHSLPYDTVSTIPVHCVC